MSKHNWVTIKNKHNGFLRTIAENEFNGMIDKADYTISSSSPDNSWTKPEIKKYLDWEPTNDLKDYIDSKK